MLPLPRLDLLEQLDLLIGLERDDGLLPVAAPAGVATLPLELAPQLHRADVGHLHLEDGLDRALDLDLVGVPRHLEVVLVAQLAQHRSLLGDQGLADDVSSVFHPTNTFFMRSSPASVTSTTSQLR